jgi:hypothetical protein
MATLNLCLVTFERSKHPYPTSSEVCTRSSPLTLLCTQNGEWVINIDAVYVCITSVMIKNLLRESER